MNSRAEFKLPRVFGKYYLLDLISIGGMAEVYRGKMYGVEGFEKIVAIKKILPEVAEDTEFIKMFIDEAKISVQLSHPNIVQILELGKIEEAYFIAMENVFGTDLKIIRKRLKQVDMLMDAQQASYIISQVCEGLDYAHRKTDEKMHTINIVHRDISPQNILIAFEGNVKLIDFGIAKAKDKSTKTQAGLLKGKFSYMSPEQVGGKELDRRSDIFSLGVVLFEILTGKRLFLGKSDVETLEKIRKADVPPPSVFNNNVSEELDRIVLKALAKDREERYQWVSEFGDDLKRYLFQSENKYSRQDLLNFMAEFFSDELEEKTTKMKSYRELDVPEELFGGGTRTNVTAPGGTRNSEVSYHPGGGKKWIITLLLLIIFLGTGGAFYKFFVLDQKENASLLIDSNIKGTLVEIDVGSMAHQRCNTPCQIDNLMGGEHILKYSKEGYIEKEESIVIKGGMSVRKMVKMYKKGEIKTIVTIKTEPDGAKIFVNEEDTGETTPAVLSLPAGVDIILRTEKEDYFPVEQNIGKLQQNITRKVSFVMKVRPNIKKKKDKRPKHKPKIKKRAKVKEKRKKKTLPAPTPTPTPKPKPKKKEMGYLIINSRPWANIYIDGKLIRATPIIRYGVTPGKHKIRFKNQRFGIDRTFPVTVKKGESKRIIKEF